MKTVIVTVLFWGVALAFVPPTRNPSSIPSQYQQQPQEETTVDRFNFIDLDLLQLVAESKAGNIVLSPASVKTVLSMVWEGASGLTAEEIGDALRLAGELDAQREKLHQFQRHSTHYTPGTTLEVANQVFISDRIKPSPSYMDSLAHYHASVQTINMSAPAAAAETVNEWVRNSTHGLIPEIVQSESIGEHALMLLANAIFFRGTWVQAFDADRTREGMCFYGNGQKCGKKAVMMETIGNFRSKQIRELDATLLELPYEGGRYSMLILLPDKYDGMASMVRNLPYGNLLHVLTTELEESEFVVAIPKFSIEYHADLVPILNKLHIKDLFTPSANLTNIIKQDALGPNVRPAVSNVFHKCKIQVDEKGATAAGVSGALVVPLMGGPQPHFFADHPFLFFIRDSVTGGFLFAGRVTEPDAGVEGAMDNEAAPAPASGLPTTASSTEPHHHAHTSKRSQVNENSEFKYPKP